MILYTNINCLDNLNKERGRFDEVNIVNVLKEYAVHSGYEVDEAFDGAEAVAKVEGNSYDCILMDIMMPNMNGYDAVRAIRAIKNIPVIMISAKGEEYDKLAGFDLGIDDYIVNPGGRAAPITELTIMLSSRFRQKRLWLVSRLSLTVTA